jgi:hypothetical protein
MTAHLQKAALWLAHQLASMLQYWLAPCNGHAAAAAAAVVAVLVLGGRGAVSLLTRWTATSGSGLHAWSICGA